MKINNIVKFSVLAVGLALAGGLPAAAADRYSFDTGHSQLVFTYNHLGLSTQHARFADFDGTVVFDPENPANSSVEVTIDPASVRTVTSLLDDDLKSANFFDVANHPTVTFKSTEVRQTGAATGLIIGDLTIKGITRPVTLNATFNFAGEHPLAPYMEWYAGAYYAAFSAHTTILRSDFDLGLYAPLTSDAVTIKIEAELRRED